MNNRQLILETMFREAETELWSRYKISTQGVSGSAENIKGLIFPTNSDGKVRVSEKEARQLVIEQIHKHSLSYSIETPTRKKYCFSGKTPRSASTDLSIYDHAGKKLFNIEFKAGARSLDRGDVKDITKDFKKLALEDVDGIWFHTLENVDIRSVRGLWQTINRELNNVLSTTVGQRTPKTLDFHLSILSLCCSVSRSFDIQADCSSIGAIDHPVITNRQSLRQSERTYEVDGWTIHQV